MEIWLKKKDKKLGYLFEQRITCNNFIQSFYLVMNRSALRLHVLCCIGPHLIAAFISLRYDIKSWYDTISATSVVLTTFVVFSTNKFFFRGTTHIACVLLGVVR
jgi:hypothetical protein